MIHEISRQKKLGNTVGFTCSSFDLCHAGHCAMLAEAKSHCDLLIVGLHTNPQIDRPTKNKPIQTVSERWIQLQSIKYIDMIIPYETEQDLVDILLLTDPDVRIIGEEYRHSEFTGHDIDGIRVIYNSRKHRFSSSGLREQIITTQVINTK